MVVTLVLVTVVPVGVVMGILVSGTVVISGVSLPDSDEVSSVSKPSGGSGMRVSHS